MRKREEAEADLRSERRKKLDEMARARAEFFGNLDEREKETADIEKNDEQFISLINGIDIFTSPAQYIIENIKDFTNE